MRPVVQEAVARRVRARAMPALWADVLAVIGAGIVVAGLVFLYLWQGAILVQLRAERAQALLAVEELERTRIYLEYQRAWAYAPDVIAVRARELGMGPFDAKRTRYLTLDDDQGGKH